MQYILINSTPKINDTFTFHHEKNLLAILFPSGFLKKLSQSDWYSDRDMRHKSSFQFHARIVKEEEKVPGSVKVRGANATKSLDLELSFFVSFQF